MIRYLMAAVLLFSVCAKGQTSWTDGAGNQTWSSTGNWSAGVPISSSAVTIQTQPTGNQIGVDTGATTIASIDFSISLMANVELVPFGGDTLTISGNIVNSNPSFAASFLLPVFAGSNATWSGGSGSLNFGNNLGVQSKQITTFGLVNITGTNLNLQIDSLAAYGRFLGSGPSLTSNVTINVGGTYSGNVGDTFDLTTGNFSLAALGTLPTLSSGMTWNTTDFLSQGVLVVLPEPTCIGLAFMGLIACFGLRLRS